MVPKGERFEMRLDAATIERIDAWRSEQADIPSRAEAIRGLVEVGLARNAGQGVHLSDGEKLLTLMMRDLYKHLKLKDGEIEPEFIAEVIWGGHNWAPAWRYPGIFHRHEDDPRDLSFVLNVLEMWDNLEYSYEKTSPGQKKEIATAAAPLGKSVKFSGFDGNNESELMGIARFLVDEMDRFSRFKGRELNAHMPTRAMHTRMLSAYGAAQKRSSGRELSTPQIIEVLKAMAYPE